MALGIESALRYLAQKLTGKQLATGSIESTIQFMADNYTAGSGTPGPAGPQGPAGADGVGIKDITGSIDGENNLSVKITLTNGESKTVTGKITPPQA